MTSFPLVVAALIVATVHGFSFQSSVTRLGTAVRMGLYDDEMPPLPRKRDPDRDRDEDFISDEELPPLFKMTNLGREKNELLPRLKRQLLPGDGLKYDAADEPIMALVLDTGCHWIDAAWALEAHEGVFIQAKWSIEAAQKRQLELNVALPDKKEVKDVDWDAELKELMDNSDKEVIRPLGVDGREQRTQNIMDKYKDQSFWDMLKGEPDQDWLPKKPPQPYDDEPWFTG